MNIFVFLYIPLLLLMLKDFRKAFLLYVLLKIFLNQNINLVNLPGVPLLTLELCMDLIFGAYFILFQRNKFKNPEKFPLKIAYILCLSSIAVSTIFSNVGFASAITRAIKEVISIYLFVYILWRILRKEEDIVFLITGFTYVFILLGVYGFYEKLTGSNPLIDYQISLNPSYKVVEWVYDEGRLNMGRVRSAILHPIGYGVYLGIIISFYYYIQNKYKRLWKQSFSLKMLLFFLCLCNLFFTNSRGPIIYLFISIVFVFDFTNLKTYQNLIFGIIGLLLAWNFIEPYFFNVISFYDKSVASSVGGSSLEMRKHQFQAAFYIFSPSPLIGLGIKSLDALLIHRTGILGAESIWLKLLIEQGILGCIAHLVLIASIAKIGNGESKFFIWGLTVAWLVTTSITSTPGIEISFFLTIIVMLNRIFFEHRTSPIMAERY